MFLMVNIMPSRKNKSGFSLYEMLVVLSIVAIMLSFAIPAVTHQLLVRNNEEAAMQFESVLKNAQEEALRRGVTITICAANYKVNDVLYNCLGTNDWSEGILSYIDLNNANGYDSGERLQSLSFTQGVTISGNESALYVNPNGQFYENDVDDSWTFDLSQTRFGSTINTKIKLNNMGYVSACKVGDSGC